MSGSIDMILITSPTETDIRYKNQRDANQESFWPEKNIKMEFYWRTSGKRNLDGRKEMLYM